MNDERCGPMIDECKRQEESCLYTSTALFEWLKNIRFWKYAFIVAPIIFGGIATWQLLAKKPEFEWITGISALLAGIAPSIYRALDFDVNMDAITRRAHEYKILQDRFRQAWRITALGNFDEFKRDFDTLMDRMDSARSSNIIPPESFFKKAQKKIGAGHYSFAADAPSTTS